MCVLFVGLHLQLLVLMNGKAVDGR